MANLSVSDLRARAAAAKAAQWPPIASGTRIERLIGRIAAGEFAAVAAVCYLTSVAYYRFVLGAWPSTDEYLSTSLLIAALVLFTAFGFKNYVGIQAQSRDRYLWSGMGAVTLAFSMFLSGLFVFKVADWYSRGTFLCQFVGVCTAVLVLRGAVHSYVRNAARSGAIEARRALLITDTKLDAGMLEALKQFGVRWAGELPLPHIHGNLVPGIEAFSTTIRTFVERCRRFKPDDIIVVAGPRDLPQVARLADALSELPVTVHVIPSGMSELWSSARIASFGGVVTLQVLRPPLSGFELAVKRIFDLCVASAAVLLLSPLLVLVSIAIKLDSRGPVLFRQNRHGFNNEVIPVLKFRTMTVMEDGETAGTFTQAKTNDSRVTRLGRVLRRTNVDELPQLFNVLRGDMSIIGPRPHPIALNAMFRERIAPFSRRHNVKPGLTGWAQVNGYRGATDTFEKMQRRIECDLYYIDNWSFTLDLKIIMMTLLAKSAYQNAC